MIPVTLIMAITVDGFIGKSKDHFANWTSPEDKQLFVKTSKDFGLIMMGENTFKTFPAPLPKRLNVVFSLNPPAKEERDNVLWVSGDPKQVLEKLKEMGYNRALLGGGATLNSLFLKEKLISELILTVEPKLFGQGLSLFNQEFDLNLKLIETKQLNSDTIMLRYKVVY